MGNSANFVYSYDTWPVYFRHIVDVHEEFIRWQVCYRHIVDVHEEVEC